MAVKSLPDNYNLNCCIDMEKDKKLAIGLNIGTLLILILLFFIGIFFLFPRSGSITISLTPMIILLIGIIFIMTIHELVHGFFFKYFSKGKVKYGFKGFYAYASCHDYYFKKNEFLVIGLAPFVILDILMGLILLFVNGALFYGLYVLFAIHTSGCIGDFYVTIKLMKYKPESLIKDSGEKIEIYVKP